MSFKFLYDNAFPRVNSRTSSKAYGIKLKCWNLYAWYFVWFTVINVGHSTGHYNVNRNSRKHPFNPDLNFLQSVNWNKRWTKNLNTPPLRKRGRIIECWHHFPSVALDSTTRIFASPLYKHRKTLFRFEGCVIITSEIPNKNWFRISIIIFRISEKR